MKSKSCIVCLILFLSLLISSCAEEEKGDYSGVSELISERNRARYQAQKDTSDRRKVVQPPRKVPQDPSVLKSSQKEEEQISSIVLYEQDIEIIGEESRKVLARGIAYINKQGQIVKIKIVR